MSAALRNVPGQTHGPNRNQQLHQIRVSVALIPRDNYQSLKKDNVRFDISEDQEFNTSKSGINIGMRKETSIRQLTSRSEPPSQVKPFESINLTIGGMTLFVPDTQGFDVDASKGSSISYFSALLLDWRHQGDQWAAGAETPDFRR